MLKYLPCILQICLNTFCVFVEYGTGTGLGRSYFLVILKKKCSLCVYGEYAKHRQNYLTEHTGHLYWHWTNIKNILDPSFLCNSRKKLKLSEKTISRHCILSSLKQEIFIRHFLIKAIFWPFRIHWPNWIWIQYGSITLVGTVYRYRFIPVWYVYS